MAVIVAEDWVEKNRGFGLLIVGTIGLYENLLFFYKVQEKA
jgi:hypothetical protein